MYTKEIENLSSERDNALEKIKKLKKNKLFLWKFKREPGQIQILSGNKCGNLWLPLWLSLMRKRHWSCKKKRNKQKKLKKGNTKLRLNTHFENLADQGYWETTVHYIFRRWINPMHVKLKFLIKWPDHNASM